MKKSLSIFVAILVLGYILLSVVSAKSEYNAEKRIWKINKEFTEVVSGPESVPEKVYQRIAGDYRKLIEDYPNSKLVPRAQILLGRVYLMKKDYGRARDEFEKIYKMFPDEVLIGSEAASMIGKSYELEGNWPRALQVYRGIQKDYPLTNVALSVPLYVAQYYQAKGEERNIQQAFGDAIAYYNQLVSEYPNSPTEIKSLRLLAVCYLAQERWRDTVDIMEKILMKYPAPKLANQSIATINNLAMTKLHDYDLPIQIYKNFISQHPEHNLNTALKEMIEGFEKLKNENVVINIKED